MSNLILIPNPNDLVIERILDIEQGIVYDLRVAHPVNFTRDEAVKAGVCVDHVRIYGVHGTNDLRCNGEAATGLWKLLRSRAKKLDVTKGEMPITVQIFREQAQNLIDQGMQTAS